MYIDELYQKEGFYESVSNDTKNDFKFGSIYRTHAYYPYENLQVWQEIPDSADRTESFASQFKVKSISRKSFGKTRSYPLATPPIQSNEEFLVIRAKIRPVILLLPDYPSETEISKTLRKKISRKRCLVGQVFSLADTNTNKEKFPREFVNRVRELEYPQFVFLPLERGLFKVPSLLRLDECQSVFTPHLEPTKFRLSEKIRALLRSQLAYLLDSQDGQSYVDHKNLLSGE